MALSTCHLPYSKSLLFILFFLVFERVTGFSEQKPRRGHVHVIQHSSLDYERFVGGVRFGIFSATAWTRRFQGTSRVVSLRGHFSLVVLFSLT